MKIRNLEELNRTLDEDLSRRKKELTTALHFVLNARQHQEEFALRASICILYAHWEGFVRSSTIAYLNFVNLKGLDFAQLRPSIAALSLRSTVRAASESDKVGPYLKVIEQMEETSTAVLIPWEDAIKRPAIINFDIFHDILETIGIEVSRYLPNKVVLDRKLIGNRNGVAHGEGRELDSDEYETMHGRIIGMMNDFKTDIENSASILLYKRTPQSH